MLNARIIIILTCNLNRPIYIAMHMHTLQLRIYSPIDPHKKRNCAHLNINVYEKAKQVMHAPPTQPDPLFSRQLPSIAGNTSALVQLDIRGGKQE